MKTRRVVLGLVTGVAFLSGCRAPGGSVGSLAIETAGATAAPGETATIDVQASSVGFMTWALTDIPESWQVTYENFNPEPTAVQESYPPKLVWDPAADSVTGSLAVSVPEDASPGEYTLTVEAGTDAADERVVSEATVTVET